MQYDRRLLEVQGLPIAYAQIGTGAPVVYVHGAVTTLEEGLVALGPMLVPRCQLTAFDRPGHGESGRDASTGSIWRQAELLTAAMSELGISRPVVVGHSFGGAVAMAIAIQSPDAVAGVVALAPIAFPEPRAEMAMFGARALPVTGDLVSAMASLVDPFLLPILWRSMFLPQPMTPAFQDGFPFVLAGGPDRLQADGQDSLLMGAGLMRAALAYGNCQKPVHVLQGDRDLVVNPLIHGRPLAAMLPYGRFTSLPGLGHMAHHFAPEVVADAIYALGPRASSNLSSGPT